MAPPSRNLELKVRVTGDELEATRERLLRHTCQPIEELIQVDRYYVVSTGRLKLRLLGPAGVDPWPTRAELIAYQRPTESTSRWSDHVVVPFPSAEAESLRTALAATHAELAVVDKKRTVGIIASTRVHLDDVAGLGTFVELETVSAGQGEAAARMEHQHVIEALGLDTTRAIGGSYSDLIGGGEQPAR